MRRNFVEEFKAVFRQLLGRTQVDLYAADMSLMWEAIASTLLGDLPGIEQCYFDGVVSLEAKIRKRRQVEFTGNMWIGDGRKQWTEPFRALVTDKTITKQGIWVVIWVGTNRAEAELSAAFGRTPTPDRKLAADPDAPQSSSGGS